MLTPSGEWKTPYLFGLLDDCSRLCCHAQWYLRRENTEDLVHGLGQGFQKREVPRALLRDNGGPMKAAETVQGCERCGIVQYLTMAHSPKQNGKMEHFWAVVEGRLMPMLEGEPELTLELLNRATQAWIEQEYHRTPHTELAFTPGLWEKMNRKEFTLTGSWMSYSAPFPGKEWTLTAHYFATGELKFDPAFIFRTFPMSRAAEAFALYRDPAQVHGKIMLVNE